MLFTPPMRAAKTQGASNKILWVMREPRGDETLHITGRLPSGRTFRTSQTAEASPDNVYPSIVNAPTTGCWQLALQWGTHQDSIAITYEP